MTEIQPAANPAIAPTPTERRQLRNLFSKVPESAALVVVLIALIVFFSIKSQYFFNTDNFTNILIASSVVGIVACPATMLLIAGQFDLSVGGATALVTAMFAVSFSQGHSVWLSVLLSVFVGIGVGALNGFLVTVIGINALITTIGTMGVMRAFAFLRTNGQAVGFNGFTTLGISRPFLNIPWMVWIFIAVVIITITVMRSTTFGRSLYAIGANPTAARLAGIRTRRVIFFAFVLSGLAVGLTGLLLASQTGQGSGNAATGLEFSAVTAVVLGGASLAGGRGSIFGTILGVLVIGVVNNGIVLL
ncbi:MAG: ribose transport system permease protein, partial [Gaiellales bacterium]|nr:ribose transport system permease protein [Gaiellales bacterium]